MAPTTMKAIKILDPGVAAIVPDVPLPALPCASHILIKVVAVALNPTDYKHIDDPVKQEE
ncbi:hypothetical protein K504DRAFT_456911 [Pleomassaria siparia CBS 279.74]|uniref:GroES-like protein n=1 Tax=Pleomassaria siparia CBS 279.74 TaxID=1314801 RepID=A0A6G1KP91_9PLEO|nr:hypothetical protein K504DRAFT_456911 [Pleomassaria siparia CBS 279.74]